MTTHLRTAGLSIRAYARETDRSEATVRLAIREGRLSSALLPSGKIDRAKADAAFARNTRGSKPPSGLNDARRRKLLAQCRLLADEIAATEATLVEPNAAKALVQSMSCQVAAAFLALPMPLARRVHGMEQTEAAAAVSDTVRSVLEDLSQRRFQFQGEPVAEPTPDYDAMDRADLAALKATLEARRLELLRAEMTGEQLVMAEVSRAMIDRSSKVRGKLLGLHVRVAPYCSHTPLPEVVTLLRSTIEEALAEFACQFVTMAELRAAAKEAA